MPYKNIVKEVKVPNNINIVFGHLRFQFIKILLFKYYPINNIDIFIQVYPIGNYKIHVKNIYMKTFLFRI